MNDEQYFRANAFLDGELTHEEHRIAAADPVVMAEVERLRALRDELRDAPPPTARARDAAIAAAMAEFTPAGASETTPEVAPPVPFRPRPAAAKYLAVAAALIAVAGLGIVVSQTDFGGGDDDDAASVADAPLSEAAARPDDEMEETAERTLEALDDEMMAESAPAADADASGTDVEGDVPIGGAADEEDAEGDEPDFGADAGRAERVVVPADFDPDDPILNEISLAIYGSYLLDQIELGELGPTPETVCVGNFDILDTATYVLDGDERDVYIAVNDVEGFVLALDVDTCVELAMGALF